MKKLPLTTLLLLAAALILVAVAAVAVLGGRGVAAYRPEAAASPEPVVMNPHKVEIVEFSPVETPVSTAPPASYPMGSVDVLADGQALFALKNEATAKQLIDGYLSACAVAGEGERVLSAAYETEIIFASASRTAPLLTYETALELLQADPSLLIVTVTAEKRTVLDTAYESFLSVNGALPEGTRLIVQLGAAGRTETVEQAVYTAGAEVSRALVSNGVLAAARSRILQTGGYNYAHASGTPRRGEGVAGKDAGGLTLSYPLRADVSSYFGFRDGQMHYGIDQKGKAGAPVYAPGEGVVIYCGVRGAYGFTVDIDHGNGFVSRLTHLADVTVALNQRVFAGEQIASLAAPDDPASTERPHIHYELIVDGVPVNPDFYI